MNKDWGEINRADILVGVCGSVTDHLTRMKG